MNPLEVALRPLLRVVNRNLAEITPARDLCRQLAGRSIAIHATNSALVAYFLIEDDVVIMTSDEPDEPDVILSGSLISLARLAGPARESLLRDGTIDLTGDAETAQQFQRLMMLCAPDPEEELSHWVGDVAAHHVGDMARRLRDWGRNAATTMTSNVSEYLQEERREVPTRYEVDRFQSEVQKLRDDVARAEARIHRMQNGI